MSKANPITEIEKFLDLLYEGEQGYVYSPIKLGPLAEDWKTTFFRWPQKREQLAKHILENSIEGDVYIAPALFKAPNPEKQGFKHSRFIWCEFDGNAPTELPKEVPEPTIKVQSSVDKHEHWYWRLQEPISDKNSLENLSKNLTYMLDADKSGWDATQVLRPPGSIHQDSGRRVKFLKASNETYSLGAFSKVIVASITDLAVSKLQDIPNADEVIQKFKWPAEARDLFNKETQPVGARSSAMTRLGFHCIEMGMSNEEAYSILLHADDRWGKYRNRSPEDRQKRLLGIITHCRSKKESEAEINLFERETFVSLKEFLETDIKVEWLFENFLPIQGLGTLAARPGVGKSTLSLRLCFNVALGQDFLIWKNAAGPKKAGFLSLEMGSTEIMHFLTSMLPPCSENDRAILMDNFFILPQGYSMSLGSEKYQRMILDEIENKGIEFLVIDSLKAATRLDEKELDKFYEWVNKEVRNNRKVTVWIIHHNRKADKDQGQDRSIDDLFGDTFIAAHPTTVILLTRNGTDNELTVHPVKIRLAEEVKSFNITRKKDLTFTKSSQGPKVKLKIENEVMGNDESGNPFNRRQA